MKKETFFYWLPRILAIGGIVFLAIFALDVFILGKSFFETATAFLVHLMPNYLLAMALIVAWKREQVGGVLFIMLAIFFTVFFETYKILGSFLLISFPTFLIGMLFLTDYIIHERKKRRYEYRT